MLNFMFSLVGVFATGKAIYKLGKKVAQAEMSIENRKREKESK